MSDKRRDALLMINSRFLYEDADAPLASAILTRADYELLVEALKEAPEAPGVSPDEWLAAHPHVRPKDLARFMKVWANRSDSRDDR